MPRLKPDTQRARREHILDAAEACFARAGFHRTTMADICAEASVSPGALYVYFRSKEDLIAGLAERDRAIFQSRFQNLATAPDLMQALAAIGESYFVDDPADDARMCLEIGIESTRNDAVGAIYRTVDDQVLSSFERLFERLSGEGRIAPDLDSATLARLLVVIGDGMMWRRAVRPDFDSAALMPAIVSLVGSLLNPLSEPNGGESAAAAAPAARPDAVTAENDR
ncbi:MAG: TetR/AcrR family transcriptional regulator [Hyphomicrobiaceae bacterium]